MRDVLLRDKCVNPVKLLRGERAMSLRYGCSRLRVLREVRDCRAASDGFASSSCGDCCWMNPERKRESWNYILIGYYLFNRFKQAYMYLGCWSCSSQGP